MKFSSLAPLAIFLSLSVISACEKNDPVTPKPVDSSALFLNQPPGSPLSRMRIVEVSPNPQGDTNEAFVLKNFGTAPVNLKDWAIRAPENRSWIMDGVILDSGRIYTYRSLFNTLLRNDGDTVYLVNPAKDTIQQVIFGKVASGGRVRP